MYLNRFVYIAFLLLLVLVARAIHAQERIIPEQTPEELAQKQTEMMVRDLDIADTAVRDTLYRLHLKYARMRKPSSTREEGHRLMMQLTEELKSILTPAQFNKFISLRAKHAPRRPRPPFRLPAPSTHGEPFLSAADSDRVSHTPPLQ